MPEEEKSSAPSSGGAVKQSSEGNKTATTVIIIIVVIVAILGVGGWAISKYVGQKIGENVAEDLIGAATGGKVDLDATGENLTVKTDEGTVSVGSKIWPKDAPSVVPKFTYGDITGTMSTSDPESWSIVYEKADSDSYETYQKDLQRAGFVTKEQLNTGSIKSFEMDHIDYSILFSIDTSSNSGNIEITAITK